MLARTLRTTYLIQFLTGALLAGWASASLAALNGAMAAAWALLGGVLWILFWQALVIVLSMWLSRAGGAWRPWLQALWGEFLAAVQIFALRQPWAGQPPGVLPASKASVETHAVPVLLVHGFVCNHRVWDKVVPALQQAGHSVLAIDLEPLFVSIDDYAPTVERAVQTLCAHTGASQVVLVGHSMGGLVIRAWLRAHGAAQVARIITLGTPHQGTRAPQWLPTANGQQMAWHSPWLTALATHETPAQRQLMQLALTQHDNVVYPQRAQQLEATQVTEFSGMGHLQMCLNPRVITWLVQQLADCSHALYPHAPCTTPKRLSAQSPLMK